jgi:arginase family enzyme
MFVVKVPGINGLGRTKGCEKAGNDILESLKEIYGNESGKPVDSRILDLEEIHLDNGNEIFGEKPKTLFLGGDHSISFSLVRAFRDFCNKQGSEPCLIVFDAHPDCMPSELGKGFPPENILLVGIRNSDPKEIEFLSKNKLRVIGMNSLLTNLEDVCDAIMEFSNGKELYLSLDIDVVDPAFAPATGYREPGGLTSRQFIYLIQRLNRVKRLRAVDLVEINPEKDPPGITVKLGAKILSELL